MRGAWKVTVVRPDGAELRLLVVAEGLSDATDEARRILEEFAIIWEDLKFGAVERLY